MQSLKRSVTHPPVDRAALKSGGPWRQPRRTHLLQPPSRPRRRIHPVRQPQPQPLDPRPRHHHRIVRAQPQRRRRQSEPEPGRPRLQRRSGPPDSRQHPPATTSKSPDRPSQPAMAFADAISQHLQHSRLESRRQVRRHPARQRPLPQPRHRLRHRRLQPGKTEIAARPPEHRAGKHEPPRIALRRQTLHRRPARPAQPQQLRHLVERLARRVIHRAPQHPVPPDTIHPHDLAMPAGNQQQQIGKRRAPRHQPRQPGRQRMRLQVIDRDERHARAASAIPLPNCDPTISPPISPGPVVAATPPSSPTPSARLAPTRPAPCPAAAPGAPARRSPAPRRRTAHARATGSPAAPPAPARSPSSTAAAVSSHELSIPSTGPNSMAHSITLTHLLLSAPL